MSKILRVITFLLASGLIFQTFSNVEDEGTKIALIGFIALLLCSIESIRRKRETMFLLQSEAIKVGKLEKEGFVDFIADLFRRLNYFVVVIPSKEHKGADLIIRKNKMVICIRCMHQQSVSDDSLHPLQAVYGSMRYYKAKKSMVISTGYFDEAAKDYAKKNKIQLLDYTAVVGLIDRAIKQDKSPERIITPQETH